MKKHKMTAEEIINLLELEPLPEEGGWFRRIFTSGLSVAAPPGGKAEHYKSGSAIYYLITSDSFSGLHSLQSAELWHFYQGDPVELTVFPKNPSKIPITVELGTDLKAGQRPFCAVEPGDDFGATLKTNGKWALLGCSLCPSYEQEDYRNADFESLLIRFPSWEKRLKQLCRR